MRRLLAAVLLASTFAPLVPAQADDSLLKDDAGDTSLASGVPGAAPTPMAVAGQSESVDLTALHVEETDETLLLVLHVAKLEGNPGGEYLMHFTWRDTEHRVVARRASTAFSNFQVAYLESRLEDDWERLAILPIEADVPKGMLTVEIPKVYVLDGKKRAPGIGDALDNIHVRADGATFRFSLDRDQGYAASFTDRMPDDEQGARYVLRMGDLAVGSLALTTDDRVRVSNGGATTFVYKAVLRNAADREDEVTLTLADVPDGWNGSVQSPIRVPAEGERTITILASVPFEHKHGGHDSFRVVAQSQRDPGSRATLRLGVLHTPIPQPAGHHPDLFLHAFNANGGAFGQVFGTVFPFSYGFMNTDSTHDGEAEGVSMNLFRGDARGWRIPLNPVLRMGLDFDVEKAGTLVGAIKGGSSGEGTVSARLFLVRIGEDGEEEGILLAEGGGAKVMLDTQKTATFTLQLTPTEDADYIPYEKDQNLELQIQLRGGETPTRFGPSQPLLLANEFKLTLPLEEYHDRLTGVGEAEEGLQFVADGAVEKTGRPGTIMTYAFDLKNQGRDVTIDLDPAGNDARLGVVVPGNSFQLAAGATKRVTLAVQIPGDATTGEQFEILIFAHAQEDPSLTALVRTLTTASTGANATDDETELLLAARDAEAPAPGFTLPLVAAALAVLALALRRR